MGALPWFQHLRERNLELASRVPCVFEHRLKLSPFLVWTAPRATS